MTTTDKIIKYKLKKVKYNVSGGIYFTKNNEYEIVTITQHKRNRDYSETTLRDNTNSYHIISRSYMDKHFIAGSNKKEIFKKSILT